MNLQNIYKNYIKSDIPNEEIKTVLEIGPGTGKFANELVEHGLEVTAIDLERSPNLNEKITFEKMSFEDYTTDKVFDLVHARNVIPFFKDKKSQLKKMLSMGKYVFFTFFGPNDPWASKGMSISNEEMLDVMKDVEILFSDEREFIGPKMDGEMKPWHIFTYLVKTKL